MGCPLATTSAHVSGIAGRYATALFELAQEENALAQVEGDLDTLQAALNESADLRDLTTSPVYSREDQQSGMRALASAMGLGNTVTNTLALMASRRRLFVLEDVIKGVKALAADARGEITAEVTSAKALTKAQSEALAKTLKASVGQDVAINSTVDESIIGGLIVKVGSRMIDTSIRSKLAAMQNAMKEVG
ncbi:ATP synthase subunit delta [Pontivivens insulae]|uniref:ATP synthase subunit delta n=1 Tax=Pontivivens insulae TaxID=1639689 RepID=A0A2R8A8H3_9RHOB|nr:ATP synthase F1 subcomplex delta subunit [Pontivivens insulae]SPF28539.1 ATP synthase subunit delta [Pontivivens insulae]